MYTTGKQELKDKLLLQPFYSPLGCVWDYPGKSGFIGVASAGPYANLHLSPDR